MSEHVDRPTLLAFVDDDPEIDQASINAHLETCAECRSELEDVRQLRELLSDPAIFDYLDAPPSETRDHYRELTFAQQRMREEEERAVLFFTEVSERPHEEWPAILDAHPEERTEGLARHLLKLAERELDRNAGAAMVLLDVAERVVGHLDDVLARTCLADIWKHRANAFRHLGEYPQSVDAASIAEAFYDSLPTGTFDAAQARYTRAVTLFKMTEYADALSDLQNASETLKTFGDSVPLAKTLVLEGVIRFEQGEREKGAALWQEAALLLEKLGGGIDLARVHANLAEYELSKGNIGDAERRALAAIAEFRSLGMDAEIIRARWTLAMIALARGYAGSGLGQLRQVANEFLARGMSADAAFVKLDLTEELVRRRLWNPAKEIAADLVGFFGSAGVTLASVAAIQYLRTAVENEQSTPNLVRYIRDFVAADDVGRDFSPPVGGDTTN